MSSNSLWKELVFLINVQEGFTKKLKKVAARKGQVKVFVDGPYGPSPDLGCFDTSVLVAGGSGVSYTLPVLLNVIERVRNGESSCRRVVFIWSIRDATHVRWIEDALMKAVELAPRSLAVSIRIFITGRLPTAESESVLSSPIEKKHREHIVTQNVSFSSLSLTPHDVKMENGRPNLGALLKEEASTTSGRMSVSVCGSQGIARAVRHALRFPLSRPSTIFNGGPSVTLHVESFGYA
ncbi:hypothetical protein AZE42_06345 [Rhizopogon vesiculosus]|uniref:Ferric reductase NAD binding domain-containing protein n=1 Tax=Rhizopogon vesiculosus TaxID=180088 RepID=A0A1J8Q485_9AGAM|nr:hypothetical protein AZE42_06345 [Rhizopogon vesiculosus]